MGGEGNIERQQRQTAHHAIVVRLGPSARLEGWAAVRFRQLTPRLTREFARLVEAVREIVEAPISPLAEAVSGVCRSYSRDLGPRSVSLPMFERFRKVLEFADGHAN